MDAIEMILTRRSIRAYTEQPVTEATIELLLKAAMAAPSASNKQPWKFVVITERIQLDKLAEVCPYGKMLTQAPLAIAVCGDMQADQDSGYWVQDCSAATQNILLAAHASGLGAVWLGVYPRPKRVADVARLLDLPTGIIPLGLLSIGYPAEVKPPSERFDLSKVHYNHW